MRKIELIRIISFTLSLFILCSLPLFLSYFLKIFNPVEYGMILGTKHDLEFTFKELVFFASTMLALFFVSLSLRYIKRRPLRWVVSLVPAIYLIAAFLFVLTDILYFLIFSYQLTFSVIQTMFNTNPDEAGDFIKLYSSPGIIIALLLAIGVIIALIWKRRSFIGLFRSTSFFITSLLFSLYGIAHLAILSQVMPGNIFTNVRYWDITIGEYKEYNKFVEKIRMERDSLNLSPVYHQFHSGDSVNKTFVLIISESLSRKHMSMYGYSRKTTPYLDADSSLVRFDNCVTSAALTNDAVPALFFDDQTRKEINIISLVNRLGYETSWISNQSGWGRKDAPIILLSQLCSNIIFNDALTDNDEANSGIHYDEEIVDDFEKILNKNSSKSKFIVLHLMGCHFDYEKRYPPSRNHFQDQPPVAAAKSQKAKEIVNAYDNAVLYHDSVVHALIEVFSSYSNKSNSTGALIFLSDHGEEVYDKTEYFGHCYPPRKDMAEIPYFLKLTDGYSKRYSQTDSIARMRVNTPYSTINNFYTLLHLLNIKADKLEDKIKRNAFYSPAYDSTYIRYVMGCDYNKM